MPEQSVETEEEMLSIEIKLIEECPDCYNIAEGDRR